MDESPSAGVMNLRKKAGTLPALVAPQVGLTKGVRTHASIWHLSNPKHDDK